MNWIGIGALYRGTEPDVKGKPEHSSEDSAAKMKHAFSAS
jgi:hypothetical protein